MWVVFFLVLDLKPAQSNFSFSRTYSPNTTNTAGTITLSIIGETVMSNLFWPSCKIIFKEKFSVIWRNKDNCLKKTDWGQQIDV